MLLTFQLTSKLVVDYQCPMFSSKLQKLCILFDFLFDIIQNIHQYFYRTGLPTTYRAMRSLGF